MIHNLIKSPRRNSSISLLQLQNRRPLQYKTYNNNSSSSCSLLEEYSPSVSYSLIVQYTNAEQQEQSSSIIQQKQPAQSPQHNSLRGSRSQSSASSQNTISKMQLESLIDKPDFEGEERLMKALTSKSKVYVSLLG